MEIFEETLKKEFKRQYGSDKIIHLPTTLVETCHATSLHI
jgi:hypothetical protein